MKTAEDKVLPPGRPIYAKSGLEAGYLIGGQAWRKGRGSGKRERDGQGV